MATAIKTLSTVKVAGGLLKRISHESAVVKCAMEFAVFLPSQSEAAKVPGLYYLSGLTCTDKNVSEKGNAFSACAEHGVAFIMPDTSPRGPEVEKIDPEESHTYDFGRGAGFYLNATQEPYSTHFHMYDYVTKELPAVVGANFNVDTANVSITGHSMGGHGALTIAMKNPGVYKSASAFSPICNPMKCPWGEKGFTGYLGADQSTWAAYDATELVKAYKGPELHLLIDQGDSDNFYPDQLLPANFAEACEAAGVGLELRMQPGYDHSYYFISTFLPDHIAHHAKFLKA